MPHKSDYGAARKRSQDVFRGPGGLKGIRGVKTPAQSEGKLLTPAQRRALERKRIDALLPGTASKGGQQPAQPAQPPVGGAVGTAIRKGAGIEGLYEALLPKKRKKKGG